MWEEEKFALKIETNFSHYILFLGVGLCLWAFHEPAKSSQRVRYIFLFRCFFSAAIAFSKGIQEGFSAFVFFFGLLLCVFGSLWSVCQSVGLTLILYICRPWEFLPANDWWAQVPRQCIWLWLFAWLGTLQHDSRLMLEHFRGSRGVGLSLLFGVWCLLTTFLSHDPSGSLQYFFDTFFRALTLVVILHLSLRSTQDVERIQFAFVIGVTTLAVYSLWRFFGYDINAPLDLLQRDFSDAGRRLEAVGSLGNSNDIAAVTLIPLGFLWPRILSARIGLGERLVSLLVAFVLLKVLQTSQSRGALLATAAQCGFFFVIRSKHPKRLALILGLGVGVLGTFANQLLGRHSDDLDASTESRMNYYVTGLIMALKSPLWGQGFGRYPYEFEKFSPVILYEWGLRTAHSSWILVIAETGLVGIVLFSAIHWHIAKSSWTLRHAAPALLLSFAGYSFTILFLSHSWLMFPWILFTLVDVHCKFAVPTLSTVEEPPE